MGDIVSIEVDGEVGEPRFEAGRSRPPWGMPLAIVVVGALLLGVAWTALGTPGSTSASSSGAVVSTPTSAPTAPSAQTPLVQGRATAIQVAPTTMPALDLHDPVNAARASLTAWGDFAATGDLAHVRSVFAVGGPQLAQLEGESTRGAPAAASAAPYIVTLIDPQTAVASTTATVTGKVVWSHPTEADQTYRWAIELHLDADGAWRLFTVRTASS